MIRIIVCDDDLFTLKLSEKLLKQAILESRADAAVVCLASAGSELLNYIRHTQESCLYFLDFDFGKKERNGIDLARRIYENDHDAKLVFVTSHTDRGLDILKSGIQAFGFIEKDPDPKKMVRAYIKYLNMLEQSDTQTTDGPCIQLPLGIDETATLPLAEISYVDSVKTVAHSICYHTFDGSEITVRDTIEHALLLLGDGFVRCHRSVIINGRHLIAVKGNTLKLSNGITLPPSLSRKKEVLAHYHAKEQLYD